MSEEIEPHILRKYEIIEKKGKGAYGIVWKGIDTKTRNIVAIKKVFDAFHNATDAQRTFREVMYLQELNGHPNIIRLHNIIKAQNNKDLYMIFDFMETDLHAVIRANILQEVHKQFIIYQVVKAIKFIHSGDLIHRDLKPSNILLDADCNVKLADFGLARSVASFEEDDEKARTEYVATRWYRAPEILLGSTSYSKAVDMWSVGCILGEMIVGKAIFPGTSTLNQLERVIELLGKPKMEDIDALDANLAKNVLDNIHVTKKRSFQSFFPGSSEAAFDLIKKMLVFNPKKRITAEQALKHPYIVEFCNPAEEKDMDHLISIPISDNKKFSIREYREALYDDINKKKKEQRKKWQQKYLQQLGVSNFQDIGSIKSKVSISKTQPAFEGKYTEEDLKHPVTITTNLNESKGNASTAGKKQSKVDQVKEIQEKIMGNLIQQRKMIEKDLMKERGFKPVKTVSDIPKEIKPVRAGFNRGAAGTIGGSTITENPRRQLSSSFNATSMPGKPTRGKSANNGSIDIKRKKEGIFSKGNFSYLGLFKKK